MLVLSLSSLVLREQGIPIYISVRASILSRSNGTFCSWENTFLSIEKIAVSQSVECAIDKSNMDDEMKFISMTEGV